MNERMIKIDTLGKRLKTARQTNKITQQELAKILNTTRTNVCNYENDRNKPSADMIIEICKTLNISADWLLGIEI